MSHKSNFETLSIPWAKDDKNEINAPIYNNYNSDN